MAFDTLAYAQRLKTAGVAAAQAEAHAQAMRDAVTETSASKADLESGFARLDGQLTRIDGRIDLLETRMDERIQALETRQEAANARRDARMMVFIVAVAALAVAAASLIP